MITKYNTYIKESVDIKRKKSFYNRWISLNIDLFRLSNNRTDYFIDIHTFIDSSIYKNININEETTNVIEILDYKIRKKYSMYISNIHYPSNEEYKIVLNLNQAKFLYYYLRYKRKFDFRLTTHYEDTYVNRYELNKGMKIRHALEYYENLPKDFEQDTIDYYIVNLVLHNTIEKEELNDMYNIVSDEAKQKINHLKNAINFDLL